MEAPRDLSQVRFPRFFSCTEMLRQVATAVVPYFPYSRQSKKKAHRGAITARMLANIMKVAGVNHVITIDLHASQMQGFFKCPIDNLRAEPLIAKWIRINIENWPDAVVVSKNPGGTKRVTSLADALQLSFGIVTTDRRRVYASGGLGSLRDSVILEAIGTDGTENRQTLEDEEVEGTIFTPERGTTEHDWAHQQQHQPLVNGESSPRRPSRQRAVTAMPQNVRTRLVNGNGEPLSSPLANSQRANSIDTDDGGSPLGLQRVPTVPGVTQAHHDEDGYEESDGEEDNDDVSDLFQRIDTTSTDRFPAG